MFLIPVMLLLQLGFQDAMSAGIQREIQNARLQQPFTLNCTYNCSNGFIRGKWTWEDTPACSKCHWDHKMSKLGDVCTVSLYIPHLIMEQTRYNYSCFSEESDHPGLPRKMELLVTLQVHDSQSDHEVPYADIVISVRGSSNPDLSGTFNQTSKNQRPRWRDEARAGLLHASADRLHIHSKEVTRKLSTTSEYAVITYSCEALS
ncbi:uncharacterized protein [Sinocyclocheilus grahami]|uniref:uncharacterized protein n=1 Tax=Sinocyclocheilus grahami TaxID=75366 RepID=UPI0007ACCE0F|nr:PREDICTED: uncharacterized protein LOC107601685 [Sinocyclocheilus grahami]